MTLGSPSLLRDDFVNNTTDPCWAGVTSGSATVAETGGQARLTLPSSTAGSHLAYYLSTGAYDLTGDSFYWNIDTMLATGVAATAILDLRSADSQNALRWTQTSGTLKAQTVLAGVATDRYSVAWNAATYKYLRVRESGGNVLFDSSTNGTAWTNRATLAAPFAVTELYVLFAASCGNVASPGSLRIEDVNLILPAPASTWRETTADWGIVNRFQPVTLAATSNVQGVLVTADTMDESTRALGGTLHYFAGPLGSSSGGFLQLTEYASLVLAQASAFPIPIDGRVDLPILVDARYMRLYHRSTDASSHTLREFLPQRLIQADMIQAESIEAINIAAGAITADKIDVVNLAAVSAQMGSLHMDGPIDITTGSITGGGGVVTLDSGGLSVTAAVSSTVDSIASYKFKIAGVESGGMYGFLSGTQNTIDVLTQALTGKSSRTEIASSALGTSSTTFAVTALSALAGASLASITLTADPIAGTPARIIDAIADSINLTADHTTVSGGLNVGTATGAAVGEVVSSAASRPTISDAGTTNAVTAILTQHLSSGIPAANFGLDWIVQAHSSTNAVRSLLQMRSSWATATDASRKARADFLVFDTASRTALRLEASGSAAMIGFLGAAAVVRPTVTGAKAGNAALTSVLTALANLGLITDSST